MTSLPQTQSIKFGISSGQLQTCQRKLLMKAFKPHHMQ